MSERSSLVDYSRSPGLDALAYVSSVELPKFSLNSRNIQNVQTNVGPVDRHSSQEAQEEETPDGRVRAYAKLEFPEHDFFIRKLSIIIGRRPPELSRKSNNQADQSDTPTRVEELIDVDLGPIRAVSRKHSKVYFNWHFGAWVLEVLGRNGCVIDGRWKAKGEVVPLRSRTKIQIAERIFYFILPQTDEKVRQIHSLDHHSVKPSKILSGSSLVEPTGHQEETDLAPGKFEEEEDFDSCCLELPLRSIAPNGQTDPIGARQSLTAQIGEEVEYQPVTDTGSPLTELSGSTSESEDDMEKSEEFHPPSPPRNGAVYLKNEKIERVDFHLINGESDSSDLEDDDMVTDSEISLEQASSGKATASKAPRNTLAGKKPQSGSGGKGQAKTNSVFESAIKNTSKVDPAQSTKFKATEKVTEKGKRQTGGKGKDSSNQQAKAKETATVLTIKERPTIKCVTPAGAEIGTVTQKPPYTYASLITQALAASADEDGKMLVSEMCEWMTGVYPFYGTKEKGSDWQSALRHNLNADKRFRRVERTPTDGGKGNFWTLKSEEWANFDGLELRRSKNEIKTSNSQNRGPKSTVGPGKSIGSVARADFAAHHRTIARASDHVHDNEFKPSAPIPDLNSLSSPEKPKILEERHIAQLITTPTKPSEPRSMNVTSPSSIITPKFTSASAIAPFKPDIHPDLLQSSVGTAISPNPQNLPVLASQPVPSPLLPVLAPPQISTPPLLPVLAPQPTSTPPILPVLKPSLKPSSHLKIKPKNSFKIVIEELPNSSKRKTNSTVDKVRSTEELSKLIEEDPPMFSESESNKLILNPRIFKSLKPSQILSLEKLGSSAAIQILQKFIVEYYKEKIKKRHQLNSHKSQPSNINDNDSLGDPSKKRKLESESEPENQSREMSASSLSTGDSSETKKMKKF